MKHSLRLKIILPVVFAAVLVCLSSCGAGSYEAEIFAMDTVMTVSAYGSNSKAGVGSAVKAIQDLDGLWSVENSQSEIYALNKNKQIFPSADTLEIIKKARDIYNMTGGEFDITVEPLVEAWGFYSKLSNRVPSDEELREILKSVGFENVNIYEDEITLSGDCAVDLGGIAKGYAAGKAAEALRKNNVDCALMSLGGNIRAIGTKPDGSPWNIAVADPDDSSADKGVLSVKDKAVVTSGGYQRYFEENGQIYHHIIDTETGRPADSGLKSVTVVSGDDTLADGLSTALFVMGLDRAVEFYNQNNELFGGVFITDENEIFVTKNLEGAFSSDYAFEVVGN